MWARIEIGGLAVTSMVKTRINAFGPWVTNAGFEIRPLLGMNQQTLLPEIEFFQIWLSFFEKN